MKKLCIKLAEVDTEKEVVQLLEKAGFWSDEKHWKNYGGIENNFSTVGNQQSLPEKALVEKIINSVDAVLMAECRLRGKQPEGAHAPFSMENAQKEFFSIPEGGLANISAKERSVLADNVHLVATGKKGNPSYAIVDRGEGQTPKKMPDTLLSLGKSNKMRIKFVQGKFNMGGTGALSFCGKQNLQLIISKRHPASHVPKEEGESAWGFTIVRRQDPKGDMRSSYYQYLVGQDGDVISFDAASLPLLPEKYPQAMGKPLEHGTYVKLYEYDIGPYKSPVNFDLYNRLSLLMPKIALPVRLSERRKGYKAHSFETTLAGLYVRLADERSENVERGYPSSGSLNIDGEILNYRIYAFKKDAEEKKYRKGDGVLLTMNGQTQATFPKAFFTRDSVRLSYIKDSLLVVLDCSKLSNRSVELLFMNSRDRLRDGQLKTVIEKELAEMLKKHEGLRELQNRRRDELIHEKLADNKTLAETLSKILKGSPTLAALFVQGKRLSDPFNSTTRKKEEEFRGNRFPTYFSLLKEFPKQKPKSGPVNRKLRIQYTTDADNEYLDRDSEPGRLSVSLNDKEVETHSCNLWNGTATLNLSLPSWVNDGDLLELKLQVMDDSRIEPISSIAHIKICPPETKTTGGPGSRRKPPKNEDGGDAAGDSKLALPDVIEIHKNEWETYEFDKFSAVKVMGNGNGGYDFYVNMDNAHLLREQRYGKPNEERFIQERYKCALALIGIAILREEDVLPKKDAFERDKEVEVGRIAKQLSPIILPMIQGLGDLEA